ncbi:hypothetical protein D8674_039629 [Pyrus ussuriensis x Pyrus communis]|uniref:Uncharacterized protein n=1 Tax=Pyrus ussuriensis x Pyrus communis TaxID=2448454 RepID=A0A5N5H0A6_9ROSA|nr:hypothetical protein D8674_039629 [Pyrus ussuriensis x Pyrus communis]
MASLSCKAYRIMVLNIQKLIAASGYIQKTAIVDLSQIGASRHRLRSESRDRDLCLGLGEMIASVGSFQPVDFVGSGSNLELWNVLELCIKTEKEKKN